MYTRRGWSLSSASPSPSPSGRGSRQALEARRGRAGLPVVAVLVPTLVLVSAVGAGALYAGQTRESQQLALLPGAPTSAVVSASGQPGGPAGQPSGSTSQAGSGTSGQSGGTANQAGGAVPEQAGGPASGAAAGTAEGQAVGSTPGRSGAGAPGQAGGAAPGHADTSGSSAGGAGSEQAGGTGSGEAASAPPGAEPAGAIPATGMASGANPTGGLGNPSSAGGQPRQAAPVTGQPGAAPVLTPGAGLAANGSAAGAGPAAAAAGAGQAEVNGVGTAPAPDLSGPLAEAAASPVPDAPVAGRPSVSAVLGGSSAAYLVPLPSPVEAALGVRLPRDRVVSYYGNPLEPAMGILGLAPSSDMLDKLHQQVAAYGAADRRRPVRAALELVTPAAQRTPGEDGLYRARMSPALIDRVAAWAEADHDLLILDVQLGRSSVADELAVLVPYLRRPYVHLALDPEFAMGTHDVPGRVIGSMDADQINEAIDTLDDLVGTDRLPPKLLIVHRFTERMVTNTDRIAPKPSVQVVMTMDGFGSPSLKEDSYRAYVHDQKVEFAGVKLFYDQDKPLLSPAETLALDPTPDVVIYQ